MARVIGGVYDVPYDQLFQISATVNEGKGIPPQNTLIDNPPLVHGRCFGFPQTTSHEQWLTESHLKHYTCAQKNEFRIIMFL